MTPKSLTLWLIATLVCAQLYGKIQVSGKVVDGENKEPLIGTQVVLQSGLGTVTDQDGNFLLELEDVPQATIADMQGIAHGALRTRLSRIKNSLLKCITHEK